MSLWCLTTTLQAQPAFNKSYELTGFIDGLVPVVTDSTYYYSVGMGYVGSFRKNIIVKFDLNGDTVMTKKWGRDSAFYNPGLVLLKDGADFIMTGAETYQGAIFPYVAKLNSNFDTLWTSQKWNLIPGVFYSVTKYKSSYYFAGTLEIGSGSNLFDLFVLKADESGNIIWQQTFSSTDDEVAYSIDTAGNGNLILAGYQDSPSTSWNLYVTKIDTNGVMLSGWPKIFGGTESEAGFVKTCRDGNYIVFGGWYTPVANAHLRKLDQNGNTIWFKNFQNPGAEFIIDEFYNLQELENGDFVLVGNYYDTTITDPAGWMLKTDSLGNEKWRRRIALRNNDNYLYGLARTPDGGFVMSGTLWPDGGGTTEDAWLVKVDSMGCFIPNCWMGIDEILQANKIVIYPNPSNGTFRLIIPNNQPLNNLNVEIFDLFGKLVHKQSYSDLESSIITIGLNGMFLVRLIDNKNEVLFSGKVIFN